MDLSREASAVFQKAVAFAGENHYEFVTPEIVLLMILDDATFAEAFKECGGDLGILENKGIPYFLIMGILAGLCILGMITFFRERKSNYVWRWIYFIGGAYLLFDLFAIATGMPFWHTLLASMFDTASPYWNAVWGFFILLGIGVFVLGIKLLSLRKQQHQ